jgi:hypothetical protein
MFIPYGVYIGKDIELLSTEKFILVYRRLPDRQRLESLLLSQDLICLGVCQTVPCGVPQMVLDLLDRKISAVKQGKTLSITFEDNTVSDIGTPPDDVKNAFLKKGVTHLSQNNNSIVIYYRDGSTFSFVAPEQINWKYALLSESIISSDEETKNLLNQKPLTINVDEDTLQISFVNGILYHAKAHELFTMNDLQPYCPTPKEASVGECLLKWNIGCTETNYDNIFSGVIINTYKHMYIFEITKYSIYCRAARYTTCDKGVVFDQNFRQGYEAYMIEDNRVAMNELEYDESLFSTDACVWNNKSVYWSTANVSEDEIELHGCQGDIYKWAKPNR